MEQVAKPQKENFLIRIMKSILKFTRNYFKKDCCKVLLLTISLSLTAKILFAQDMPGMNMQNDTSKKLMNMPMDSTQSSLNQFTISKRKDK